MMIQYKKIKERYRDAILFFRLGDFYEMFREDAKEASALLDLTLTKRNGVPMCGIPYHASKNYISRLLRAGKKVAVCEQISLPKPGKGIAKREVVEVITPGTIIDEQLLERNSNNYLVSVGKYRDKLAIAYVDLSTAEFTAASFTWDEKKEYLKAELNRLQPKEIIIQESLLENDGDIKKILYERDSLVVNRYPDWSFDMEICRERLKRQLGAVNLKGYGLSDYSPEIVSAGTILEYLFDTAKKILPHIKDFKIYKKNSYLILDESTQKNLELVRNLQDGSRRYTLLEVLSNTKTAMGSRMIRRWILNPIRDKGEIEKRLDGVQFFYKNQLVLSAFRENCSRILDLERLATKIAMEKANAKDMLALKETLEALMKGFNILKDYGEIRETISYFMANIDLIENLHALLDSSIYEDPPVLINEGNLIKKGYSEELDRLKLVKKDARSILDEYLKEERVKTGIQNLKLRYNRIIGYYFEVTKSNIKLVPNYFIRRQSLVNGERYSTEALIGKELKINSASEKIIELEKDIFLDILAEVKKHISELLKLGSTIAYLDVLQSMAFAATVQGYIRPKITGERELKIINGRHPVVEANLPSGGFVPNSTLMSPKKNYFILLTGPNMAGKSTYLRQVALIVLMAHIGSFVPADEASIGVVDQIFCRVGATDNLARGESTFLVEMSETANILRSATGESLVIMDEVGRGTGTRDGLAIALAIVEYLTSALKAKVLFATHYHELTGVRHKGLINMSMEVLEKGEEIIFLKRLKEGPADHSYGIHVAKLAGIPETVIKRAQYYLEMTPEMYKSKGTEKEEKQQNLFTAEEMIIDALKAVTIENITPLKALNILAELKNGLNKNG